MVKALVRALLHIPPDQLPLFPHAVFMVPKVADRKGLLNLAVAIQDVATEVPQPPVLLASPDMEVHAWITPPQRYDATKPLVPEKMDLAGLSVKADWVVGVLEDVLSKHGTPEQPRNTEADHTKQKYEN